MLRKLCAQTLGFFREVLKMEGEVACCVYVDAESENLTVYIKRKVNT